MAFEYDDDDQELDENGLPVEDDSSLEDLMDYVRSSQDIDYSEEYEDNSHNNEPSDDDKNNKENDSSQFMEDSRDRDLRTAGEHQGPKTPQEKLEENFLTTKLTRCEAKLQVLQTQLSQMTVAPTPLVLTPTQFAVLKDAQSLATDKRCLILHPIKTRNIRRLIRKINKRVLALKASFWIQKLGPILPYIAIGILVVLVIIMAVAGVAAIAASFNKATDPTNMDTNTIITSEYFYGTRSVYIDETALTNELQLSYKQYVIDVVENFEESNPNIDITIELPELAEGEIFTNETAVDEHINNLSLGLANIVATGSSEYLNVNFATLYPQIEYFGLTAEQNELVTDFISKYIVDNSLYLTQDAGANIGNLIKTTITDDADLQYILNLAEKVMLKDEIATETGIIDIEIRQYIASIYMPNKDIIIESASYVISSTDEVFNATSKLIEENNGTEIIQREKETTDNRDIITGFITGNVNVKKFTGIDENNPNTFRTGMSIFSAMRLSPEYKDFFTLNADGIYTWKPNCDSLYYLTFDAETPFIFTDFLMNVKLP